MAQDESAQAGTTDLHDSWRVVETARHPQRPYCLDYVARMPDRFVELHGDRRFADDGTMVAGLGFLEEQAVAVVGQQKGRTAAERRERNFGMARPEGYRKALRVMKLAADFGRPLITLIDTPGADCLEDSEGRGISEAIARNQLEMFSLPVPILVVEEDRGRPELAITQGMGYGAGSLAQGIATVVHVAQQVVGATFPHNFRLGESGDALRGLIP